MGTELVSTPVKEDKSSIPSIPTVCESLTPFTVNKVESTETKALYFASANASKSGDLQMETSFDSYNYSNKPLWLKPRIADPGENSDPEQNLHLTSQLSEQGIRGCDEGIYCQKVTTTWNPEDARVPDIQNAPVFYPTEEEYEDTLKFLETVRSKAESYGICRIVPPPSWKPQCHLKDKEVWENSKFTTRIQRIDKLQNRESMTKIMRINYNNKKKKKKKRRRRAMKNGTEQATDNEDLMVTSDTENDDPEFGFDPGDDFTFDGFQKYANDFKAQYFMESEYTSDGTIRSQHNPSVEEIEGEFWRIVENPTDEIEVLYGNDIETGEFGSGFPKHSDRVSTTCDARYLKSWWNLNNLPRLPGTVLPYESSDISGVVVPWLYVGMCFSSFCWHVEDHHLYSLNYMHFGEPKMWYGVPGSAAQKLEAAMKKHLPDLFEEEPDLLHKLVTQLSPSILKAEGVPVYRVLQNPGEFVLTFPRAYHAGFNCGFNCAEAVNVAPIDWLLHGQNAIELYRCEGRKTSISHDKLLLGAARDAVKALWELNLLRKNTADNFRCRDVCGKDGILSKALKARVLLEQASRELLGKSPKALKMESSFDATCERECSVCFFDLHLSAAGCHNCSPDKYACLKHAKQLCSCSWGAKFFLFRYDVNELNMLVEALEGKLSAVYRWAKSDIGLALSSAISRENELSGHVSYGLGSPTEVVSSQFNTSVKELKKVTEKPAEELLAAGERKPASMFQKLSTKRKEIMQSVRTPASNEPKTLKEVMQLARTPQSNESHGSNTSEIKTLSLLGSWDVIVLSDDEDEKSNKPHTKRSKESPEKQVVLSNIVTQNVPVSNLVTDTSVTNTAVVGETTYSSCIEGTDMKGHLCNRTHFDHPIRETHVGSISRPCESVKSDTADSSMKLLSDGSSGLMVHDQNLSSSTCISPNNLDKYYHQKGPHIAKVVRKINFNVQLLAFGVVQQGQLWCDSQAIYPKGFKSRVRYINAVDPTEMCYYISEILDAGIHGPLFMVVLENRPSEVFVHISASKCWELVRERVNLEIMKQNKLGKINLPSLQPPGSLNGMEMFGFTSSAMIQAIEAMDEERVCREYWKARPVMQQITQHSQPTINLNLQLSPESSIKKEGVLADTLLRMFKNANYEELDALHCIVSRNALSTDQDYVSRLLEAEFQNRSR